MNTIAIQATIDECSAKGGGVVVIPQGTFLSGAIFLKQGVSLHLEKNSVLKGTNLLADFPKVYTRFEGEDRLWTSALINAQGLNNIQISGDGTIDGSGTEWPKAKRKHIGEMPPSVKDSLRRAWQGPPRLICIQNCKSVIISNVHLLNHSSWCLHILYSSQVRLINLNIRANHTIPSSDGIDIDSSNEVIVKGCDIDVNDDCISIKSCKDTSGLRVNRPSENITIENCRFGYGHGGVALGSETSGSIRNVRVKNCVVDSGNWAPIRFKTQPSRGGVVEDVVFENLHIVKALQAFEFIMEWRMVLPVAPPAKVLPVFRNIRFVNIYGVVTRLGIIDGLKDSPITDVSFENCTLTANFGLIERNVKNIDYSGLKATIKDGKTMISNDSILNLPYTH